MTSRLWKSKTFYGGIASIITGIGLIVSGDAANGINMIGGGVLAIFLRDGIAKAEK